MMIRQLEHVVALYTCSCAWSQRHSCGHENWHFLSMWHFCHKPKHLKGHLRERVRPVPLFKIHLHTPGSHQASQHYSGLTCTRDQCVKLHKFLAKRKIQHLLIGKSWIIALGSQRSFLKLDVDDDEKRNNQ